MKSYLDLTENIFYDKMVSTSYLDEATTSFSWGFPGLGQRSKSGKSGIFGQPGLKTSSPEEKAEIARAEADEENVGWSFGPFGSGKSRSGMFGQPGLKTLSPDEKAEIARSEADEKIRVARETQKIKDESEIAKNNLQIELKRMEIEAAREERIANSAAKTFLGKTTRGTAEALGKALVYSTDNFFRFVKKRPRPSAGIAAVIVADQLAASQLDRYSASLPKVVKWIGLRTGKFFLDASGIGNVKITLNTLRGLLGYVAIFVAAGLTIYAAFKLIKFLIDLGEAKAKNIIRRIELSADDPDQLQAILSRELNVDTSKLKRSRR